MARRQKPCLTVLVTNPALWVTFNSRGAPSANFLAQLIPHFYFVYAKIIQYDFNIDLRKLGIREVRLL